MVVIGTPTTGLITARTTESLCRLIAYESKVGADVEFKPLACTFLPQARTQLIQHAMQRRASHLLFIDGDMTFPANALTRLFKHGEMVVGANYRRRSSHGHKFTATTDNQPVDSVGKAGLEAVDFLGLGVCLIDLQRSAGARDLDRRVIRIKIGSGINKTDRQHRQDQYVFPQRVFVQHHAARL